MSENVAHDESIKNDLNNNVVINVLIIYEKNVMRDAFNLFEVRKQCKIPSKHIINDYENKNKK